MVTPAQAITPQQKDYQRYMEVVPPPKSLIEFRIEDRDKRKHTENWWVTAEDACKFGEEVEAWKREYLFHDEPDPVYGDMYVTYAAKQKLDIFDYLAGKNSEGPYNIFIGMVPRKYPNGSLAQDAVDDIYVVWADYDTDEAIKGYFQQVETAGFLAPSFVSMSGNGYHVYWKLSEPISHAQFKKFQQLLADKFSSDCSIKDAARLDRVPGFFNYKKDKEPKQAYVHTAPTGHTYTIAEIEKFVGVEVGSIFNLPGEPDDKPRKQRNRNRSKSGSTSWDDASATYWGDWKVGTPINIDRHLTMMSIAGYLRQRGHSIDAVRFILKNTVAPFTSKVGGARDWSDVDQWSYDYAEATRPYIYEPIEYKEVRPNTSTTDTPTVDDCNPKDIIWMWPEVLPKGQLVMLSAEEGVGKSTLVAWIASNITQGGAWPNGGQAEAGKVIWYSAEESPDYVLAPRFIANAARGSQILLPKDITQLPSLCEAHPDVRLVVLDPITSYIKGNENSNSEVRASLEPLAEVAIKHGVTILGLSHFNKKVDLGMINRTIGSRAWSAVPRMTWAVTRPKDGADDERLLSCVKNNLGPKPKGLMFAISGHEKFKSVGVVSWRSGRFDVDLDAKDSDEGSGRLIDECAEWLKEYLWEHGPTSSNDVITEGEKKGYKRKMLFSAKQIADVKVRRTGFGNNGGWTWSVEKIEQPASVAQKGVEDDECVW